MKMSPSRNRWLYVRGIDRYDFNLRTGESETGLKACTYALKIKDGDEVWVESPDPRREWEVVNLRPVSEEFADPPHPPSSVSTALPDVSALSLSEEPPYSLPSPLPQSLVEWAIHILNTASPSHKVFLTRHVYHLFSTGQIPSVGRSYKATSPPDVPPRPQGIVTVEAGKMGKRGKAGNARNRARMLHALANIEQWAIDLAWDIIARFGSITPPLPHAFFTDFLKVALDESKHFSLLSSRLASPELSTPYGSLPIHSSLWTSAQRTAHCLRSRLAIIHLVHEARGLDVNPQTIEKFKKAGDEESVSVLEVIHADEVTHVMCGHRWFVWCCENGVGDDGKGKTADPVSAFREEVKRHFDGGLKGPFNEEDRRRAGLTREFYEDMI